MQPTYRRGLHVGRGRVGIGFRCGGVVVKCGLCGTYRPQHTHCTPETLHCMHFTTTSHGERARTHSAPCTHTRTLHTKNHPPFPPYAPLCVLTKKKRGMKKHTRGMRGWGGGVVVGARDTEEKERVVAFFLPPLPLEEGRVGRREEEGGGKR